MSALDIPPAVSLRVSEIFYSLQGETSRVGLPTVFIRLTGCPLRCRWCDTPYSFQGGEALDLSSVLNQVASHQTTTVCVTGGEPLSQKNCLPLLVALCNEGYSVSLETSGALDISGIDPRVMRIVDIKPPGSGESPRNRWENLSYLTPRDEVKFVLADRSDYEWACARIAEYGLAQRCPVLLSPVHGELAPAELADWILEDHLPVRMQLQLHKLLWGNIAGK